MQSSHPGQAPGGFCPACLLRDAEEHAEIAAVFPQLEVLGLIGQGGMGFVYKVWRPGAGIAAEVPRWEGARYEIATRKANSGAPCAGSAWPILIAPTPQGQGQDRTPL